MKALILSIPWIHLFISVASHVSEDRAWDWFWLKGGTFVHEVWDLRSHNNSTLFNSRFIMRSLLWRKELRCMKRSLCKRHLRFNRVLRFKSQHWRSFISALCHTSLWYCIINTGSSFLEFVVISLLFFYSHFLLLPLLLIHSSLNLSSRHKMNDITSKSRSHILTRDWIILEIGKFDDLSLTAFLF